MGYNNRMSHLFQLPFSYFLWHYSVAWVDLLRLYTNLFWFLSHYFSIGILFRTLFSPWRRLIATRERGNAGLLGKLIVNTITRCVGLLVRAAVILTGIFALLLLTACFAFLLALFALVPLIVPALIISGLTVIGGNIA